MVANKAAREARPGRQASSRGSQAQALSKVRQDGRGSMGQTGWRGRGRTCRAAPRAGDQEGSSHSREEMAWGREPWDTTAVPQRWGDRAPHAHRHQNSSHPTASSTRVSHNVSGKAESHAAKNEV